MATIPKRGVLAKHSLFVPGDEMGHTNRYRDDTAGTGVFLESVCRRDVLHHIRFAASRFDSSTPNRAIHVQRDVLLALGFVSAAH